MIWNQWCSHLLVWKLPETKILQGLHQWKVLNTKNNGFQCTTRLNPGSISIYLLCINTKWNSAKIINPKWLCWWSLYQKKLLKPTVPNRNSRSVHTDEDDTLTIMEKSMLDIKSWMDAVKLKLNEIKTECIYFGGRQQLAKTQRDTININGKTIQCTNKIKYLGGHLDSSLIFKDHIIAKSKAATINITKIRNIRKYLSQDTCHKLVITLVLSHFDYSNLLLSGLPDSSINILQKSPKQCSKISTGEKCKPQLNWKH